MKRVILSTILLPFVLLNPLRAGTAQEVQYGVIQDMRMFTQPSSPSAAASTTTSAPTSRPLRTAGAAALGGTIGHQFGGGDGQDVATAVGALAGARASRQRQAAAASASSAAAASAAASTTSMQLVEFTIKTDAGKLLSITQENKSGVTFAKGEKVKILSSANDSHVEKTN